MIEFSLRDLTVPACSILRPWTSPSGWTGPDPVVYRSFDCPDGLIMMEGTQLANLTFTDGKVKIYNITTTFFLITARIQSMGKLMFSVCSHLEGYPGQVLMGGYPGQVQTGVSLARSGQGVPQARSGWEYPRQGRGTPQPGQDGGLGGGTPARAGVPPLQRWDTPHRIGHHMEYLIWGRRYASCVYAGGLSWFFFPFIPSYFQSGKINQVDNLPKN